MESFGGFCIIDISCIFCVLGYREIEMMEYKINENKVSAARYESYAMKLYLAQWWWIYLLPVIGCLCLSAFNINFIYVAVILLFIVASLVLSFVYIYYILVEESKYRDWETDRKSTRLNSSHRSLSRMPSSA